MPVLHSPFMLPSDPFVLSIREHASLLDSMPSKSSSKINPEAYTNPFLDFISANPTTFHTISSISSLLTSKGFTKLSERDLWSNKLEKGGKYYYERNGSGLIAFTIGSDYTSGNGCAVIASHIDALTAKVKPVSTKQTKAGFQQLGIAPYAGALNQTWIDRDLGIGGRVFVKSGDSGKIETKLVKLGWPIARIPSLAPHFGIPAEGQANKETRMVPIIGLDNSDVTGAKQEDQWKPSILGGAGTFAATQPAKLVKAIAGEMGVQDCEYLDTQPQPSKARKCSLIILQKMAASSTGSSKSSIPNRHSLAVSTKNSSLPGASTTSSAPSPPSTHY